MALVPMRLLLDHAAENGYGIPTAPLSYKLLAVRANMQGKTSCVT